MKKNYLSKARVLLCAPMLLLGAWSAHAQFPAPYCTNDFPDGVEPITLVNFAGINNTSVNTLNTDDMQDFTAITGTVTPTNSYPITLKGNTGGSWTNYFRVFVDWNDDGDFGDANESYDIGTIYASSGLDATQATGNILIPASATAGNRRMRIMKKYAGHGEACNTTGFGQSEDYTLIVTAPPACAGPAPVSLTDANPYDITVGWTSSVSNPSEYEYELRTSGAAGSGAAGLINSGTSTGLSNMFNQLAPDTDYTFYIRSNCGAGSFSDWISFAVSTIPVPPANDECSGAISLTVNPDYMCAVTTAGTTVSATQSMEATPCYGNPDDDVWYSFVATGDTHMVSLSNVVAIDGASTDLYFQVLSGACDALESVYCSDANTSVIEELTPGDTYYVRVYSYYTSHNTFSICIGTDPGPPANDDCQGAIALTVNPDLNCAVKTSGTTVGAGESMGEAPCYGNSDDDVWFSFVATGESQVISLSDVSVVEGWSTDMYFQVLSGTCDGMDSMLCSDNDANTVSGLTIGDTYFVRVYSYYGDSRQNFKICVGSMPPPPANDDCTGAVALTVNAGLTCTTSTDGTTMGATNSMEEDPCSGNADDDVWYSFVATAEGHLISLTNINATLGYSTDMYFQVFDGACASLNSVLCSDNESNTLSDLTVGGTYYVRVYSYGSDSRQTFKICVATLPGAPANDDCENAVVLAPNPDLSCTSIVAGTTMAATNSMDEDPCYGNADDDVWYTFEATADTHIISITNVVAVLGGSTDMYFQVLEGACDAFNSLECSDADSIMLEDLAVGNTYYIRVYSYGTGNAMNFNLCITSIPADPPVNDDCEGAIALTAGATFATSSVQVGTNGAATTSSGAPAPGCAEYMGGDVWYSVVVPASGTITVETNSNPGSGITDTGLALYSGTCGSFTLIECDDDDSDDGNFSKIALTGRTAGEVIYARVWEYGGNAMGTFKVAAYDASMSTESFTQNTLTHYPNPVKDVLNLSHTTEINSVTVYNMIGQQVLGKNVNATETALDMSGLAAGAYIINVATGNSVKTIKIIKN